MPKKQTLTKNWQDSHYVTAYELARLGHSNHQIGEVFGVTPKVFSIWVRERPALSEALEKARRTSTPTGLPAHLGSAETFSDYVYRHCPIQLRPAWNAIMKVWKSEGAGGESVEEAVERLTKDFGKRERQALFLHALASCNFKMTEACRVSGVGCYTARKWASDDEDFARMYGLMREMRQDFVEDALMGAVGSGEVSAIIYANRTINRNRGYDPKSTLELIGGLKHLNDGVGIDEILDYLSPAAKREVLDAIRSRREGREPPKQLPNFAHRAVAQLMNGEQDDHTE